MAGGFLIHLISSFYVYMIQTCECTQQSFRRVVIVIEQDYYVNLNFNFKINIPKAEN